jgi:hypothetical protein
MSPRSDSAAVFQEEERLHRDPQPVEQRRVPLRKNRFFPVPSQFGLARIRVRAVACEAQVRQNRADITVEVNFVGRLSGACNA